MASRTKSKKTNAGNGRGNGKSRRGSTSNGVIRVLVIPDTHIPYESESAYSLMLHVALHAGVSEIVILGDYADFYSVSSYAKDPELPQLLSDEIEAVNSYLDQLDDLFPNARKVYIEGNHENRLQRYIHSKAPELSGLMSSSVPHLLNIRGRNARSNWKWVPYGPQQLYQIGNSKLYARHEPLGGSTHAAHSSVVKAGCSLIFGHIHRIQESQIVNINGENHRGISCGWLGDGKSEVFNYVKEHHQWAHGFSIVDVLPDGTFFNNMVHIIDGKCSYGGHIFSI